MAPQRPRKLSPPTLRTWTLGCALAMAAWLSDRWIWMLPGLLGVMWGVWRARTFRAQAAPQIKRPLHSLNALLILASFVYLYVVFLLLQLARALELLELGEAAQRPSALLLIGFFGLSALLLGLGAAVILKMAVPSWLSRVWLWLLQER